MRPRPRSPTRKRYGATVAGFRELDLPFWLAVTLLEQGEPDCVEEAREIFMKLRATPWLERFAELAAQTADVTVP